MFKSRVLTVGTTFALALFAGAPIAMAESSPSGTVPPAVANNPTLQALMAQHPGGTLGVGAMTLDAPRTGAASATPNTRVTGNCGSAWIYDTPGTPGHVNEAIGLNLDYAIAYGGGDVPWHNYTNGNGNNWQFTVGPSLSGNWNGAHSPTTGRGNVTSWLSVAVMTVAGRCTSGPGLWSVAYAP